MIIKHRRTKKGHELAFETPLNTWSYEYASGVKITLDMKDYWELGLAHELGHLLHLKFIKRPKFISKTHMKQKRYSIKKQDRIQFRKEIIAWRIAKSIIKPKLWNEKEALDWLNTYNEPELNIDIKRIKIIKWR